MSSGAIVRVALDAMGGDRGPEVTVEGAVAAARELGSTVILVGNEAVLRDHLARHDVRGLAMTVRHAPEAVEMGENPMSALRKKKHSSIRIGLEMVKKGEAEAFVSAGNTGAVMATALVVLGPLPGVERPAIAVVVPTVTHQAVLLDVGANVDCKPRHLVQFAIMGNVYARDILGQTRPRVGLLSIGEEESKGNELTREAFKEMEEERSLNFIGNVEGRDVFSGIADVVVCDGFIGNVALKISEGLVETIFSLLREELKKDLRARVGSFLLVPTFRRFKRRIDSSEYGGAPLLGVNGVCMISHGRSTGKAIRNAIRAAEGCVNIQVIAHIREGVARG
jgi:glycerol-3-phosphate acyltransferase PlsX